MNENRLTLEGIIVKFQNSGFKESSYNEGNELTSNEGKKENKFMQRNKNYNGIILFKNKMGCEKALGQCLQNSEVKIISI